MKLLLILCLTLMATSPLADNQNGNDEVWQSLRWRGISSSAGPSTEALMKSKVEDMLELFQMARPLNPPTGLLDISPRAEFLRIPELTGVQQLPEPVVLRMPMRFPGSPSPSAGVNIWINEPCNLLGDPVLTDESGEIFLLPPLIGNIGRESVYSRTGHPPGFDEAFPASSLFPLWATDQEPFLRSIVRPAFGLWNASVFTIFTRGDRNFWKPVSQERWIQALIDRAQGELDMFTAGFKAASDSDVTRQQVDQIRARLQKLRDAFDEKAIIERHNKALEQAREFHAMMQSMNPEEAKEYYRQTIEGADQRLEETLAAAAEQRVEIEKFAQQLLDAVMGLGDISSEAESAISTGNWDRLEEMGRELDVERFVYLADAGRATEKLKAELGSLSPAQRRAPAWGFEVPPWHPLGPHRHVVAMPFDAARPSGLVEAGTEGARALVAIDEDFFAFAERDGGIHLLAVEWWEEVDARYRSEGGMFYNERRVTMLEDLWGSINWAALRKMIE